MARKSRKKTEINEMYLQSLARGYTPVCMKALGGWATAGENGEEYDPDLKFRAIALLLDRGWGRPVQSHKHEGGESPIEFIIRNLNAEKDKKK